MNGITEFVKSMGAARIASLLAVGAFLLGFFVYLTVRMSQPDLTLLYSDMTVEDSAAVIAELESLGVPFELAGDGTVIRVPDSDVLRLRMRLAEKGLPAGGTVGFEIFDVSDALDEK